MEFSFERCVTGRVVYYEVLRELPVCSLVSHIDIIGSGSRVVYFHGGEGASGVFLATKSWEKPTW